MLITSDPKQKLLRLEVVADTVVGRVGEDTMPPHLDLGEHFKTAKGISRRHALLRPTDTDLFLIDLGSTNGTFLNEKRLPPRMAQKVSDEDIITFANFHLKIMFVSQPAGASKDG
jgi:pSer/pThr/pTyr-binding forkhead associated (FHA) protein